MQSWIPWLLIGLASSALHLALLRRSLEAARGRKAELAGRRVAGGLPLRLLALSPVLYLAARSGLAACIGLAAGLSAGRILAGIWVLRGPGAAADEGRIA